MWFIVHVYSMMYGYKDFSEIPQLVQLLSIIMISTSTIPPQGVCDSAQGFANAVLFLLFTRDYRQWMWRGVRECCCPPARPRPRQSAQHSLHSGVNADYVSPYDDDHSAPLPQ